MHDPDIAFHRYLQRDNITAELRGSSKQTLEELDQELGFLMKSAQNHLNKGFALDASRVWTNGQHPNIHFDFIKPGEQHKELLNAYAFSDDDCYFIGLTTPLVVRLSECSGYLAESPRVRTLFRIPYGDLPLKDQVRARILHQLFFGQQLNMVVLHELGHHLFGHTMGEENRFWKEFLLDSQRQNMASLTSHAYEIQADNYACESILTALFETDIGSNTLRMLGRLALDPEAKELLIGVYLVALCSVLFALPNPSFDANRLEKEHPLKAARLNNMVAGINRYLRRAAPDLTDWLTDIKFQAFVETVESSIPPISASWDDETSFLLSESGAKYYEELMTEVNRLNSEPTRHQWTGG